MPDVTLDVSNEVPARHRVTLIGVRGTGFRPFTQVNIGVFGPNPHRVLAHWVDLADGDGSFEWGTAVSPQLPCNSSVYAVVHDGDGTEVETSSDVFCP